MSTNLKNEIKIWTVEEGEATEIKINDFIFPISKDKDTTVDPLSVAEIFLSTFDLSKPVKRIGSKEEELKVKRTKIGTLNTIYDRFGYDKTIIDRNPDIIGELNKNFVKRSKLLKIYTDFKDKNFSITSLSVFYKGVFGFSIVTIAAHVNYLKDMGLIERIPPNSENRNTKLYKFVVPPEKWGIFNKVPVNVDFDKEDIRKRRLLELETARRS